MMRRRLYRRKRNYRRKFPMFNRITHSPVCVFTHRYRIPNALLSGAGGGHTFNDFGLLQAGYDWPISGSGANGYFDLSSPLKALLLIYYKYKLVNVRMICNNFRFFRIKCYIPESTQPEQIEALWKYFTTKYKDDVTPSKFDPSKFVIQEEELLTLPIEYFYDRTTSLDGPINYEYRVHNTWQVPAKRTVCRKGSRFAVAYYPRGLHCADSVTFFGNKHSSFPSWVKDFGATQAVPLLWARPSMGVLSVVGSDYCAMEFVVIQNNIDVYFRFKFCAKAYDTIV